MKRIFAVILILSLCVAAFFGCAQKSENDGKINVIATVFPAYDFAREIAGESANVRMLLPAGAESHSYEPSAKDIIDIANCDLFIYTGGESDAWVEDILSSVDTPVNTLKMMDAVSLQASGHDHGNEEKYDEHVWTSPANAKTICTAICENLCEQDPENTASYEENRDAYISELDTLDAEFKSFFDTVKNKTLIFGDRFPFAYFANYYGLDYISAFPGCSSETEPSMATVAEMIDEVKEKSISTVFYIEFSNHNIADAIAEATGAKTALLHSCHNVSSDELAEGVSYLKLMRENLETLKGSMK